MNNRQYVERYAYKFIAKWAQELYDVKGIRMSYDDRRIAERVTKSYAFEYMVDHPKMDIQQYDLNHIEDIGDTLIYRWAKRAMECIYGIETINDIGLYYHMASLFVYHEFYEDFVCPMMYELGLSWNPDAFKDEKGDWYQNRYKDNMKNVAEAWSMLDWGIKPVAEQIGASS